MGLLKGVGESQIFGLREINAYVFMYVSPFGGDWGVFC